MVRTNRPEMEAWIAEWPIGSRGMFGGRIKEEVKVVGVLVATTGHTYYCKYGMRRDLEKQSK